MIKQLIKLANHLDKKGLHKEADYLDTVIRKYSAIDDDEQGVLNKLKDMYLHTKKLLLNRTPHEKAMDAELHKHDYVPVEVKDKIWNWMSENGVLPSDYQGKSWQEVEDIERDKGIDDPIFWEVKPGNTGYHDSLEAGWTTGSEEDGTLKVYYGEM